MNEWMWGVWCDVVIFTSSPICRHRCVHHDLMWSSLEMSVEKNDVKIVAFYVAQNRAFDHSSHPLQANSLDYLVAKLLLELVLALLREKPQIVVVKDDPSPWRY